MRKITVIKNGTVITPSRTINNGVVIFEDGKITAVGKESDVKMPKGVRAIDASGKTVAPGFIDIHTHGGRERDVMEGSYEAINELARFVASHGTTVFLPSTVSASRDDLLNAVTAVKTAMERGTEGAEVLGAHLEGLARARMYKV